MFYNIQLFLDIFVVEHQAKNTFNIIEQKAKIRQFTYKPLVSVDLSRYIPEAVYYLCRKIQ